MSEEQTFKLIIDTETTGPSSEDEIIEFAYIKIDCNNSVVKQGDFLIHAEKVNKISKDKIVKEGVTTSRFIKILNRLLINVDTIVAHNAAFDIGMIKATYKRYGVMLKKTKVVCTMNDAKCHFISGYRLHEVYNHFYPKDKKVTSHRASDITLMCFMIYTALQRPKKIVVERLKTSKSKSGFTVDLS